VSERRRLVVLDASAVLAWLMRERGKEIVDRVLPFAVVPASALTEALYRAVERAHALPADELYQSLLVAGIEVEPVTERDAVRASELIAWSRTRDEDRLQRSLSLGDGLCIAVAERLELTVTGGDDYWESVPMRVDYAPFR
jgi:ribonuclease VapC